MFQRARDKRWVAQVLLGYDGRGKPKFKLGVAKSQSGAIAKLNQIMAQVSTGQAVSTDRKTVSTYLHSWLETKGVEQLAPKTLAYYKLMIERHIIPGLGRIELKKLSAQQVQGLLNEKCRPSNCDEGSPALSPNTVKGIRAVLRSALKDAWRIGLVTENVALKVSTPKIVKADPVYLSSGEVGRLCESAKNHSIENLIRLALGTGLRVGEATGLRWQDVDVKAGVIRVNVQLQRVAGRLVLRPLKSAASRRVLPLLGSTLEAIVAQKVRQDDLLTRLSSEARNPLGLVFLNDEGRPLDPKFVDKHLKRLCLKAKVQEISFHKLRHTAATHMVAAGAPLAVVKDQLGHSSIALTTGTYAHMVPSAQKEAVEALERVYAKTDG